MIAGKIDATRADYDAWSKEDSTIANTYFADLAVVELTGSNRQAQRDALYVDLFTEISLNGAEATRVETVNELSPGSSAAVLERISSALPLNEWALAVARIVEPQGAEVPARRERK